MKKILAAIGLILIGGIIFIFVKNNKQSANSSPSDIQNEPYTTNNKATQPNLPLASMAGTTQQKSTDNQPNLDKECLANEAFATIALQEYSLTDPESDQMLKRINFTLEPSCTLISSVRKEIPEMQENKANVLGSWLVGNSLDFYFDVRTRPTFATTGVFYKFNPNTGIFSKLVSITPLTSSSASNSLYASCESHKEIAFIPNRKSENGQNRILYLLDLATDSYKKIVTLPEDESFNSGTYGQAHFDVLCYQEKYFRYAVYEQNSSVLNKSLKTYRDYYFQN